MVLEEDTKQHEEENLKAIEYYKEHCKILNSVKIVFEVMLSFIHDVIKSRRFKGEKLLEIGSGATVHNIASASAYFPIILQSDFVEDNREALKQWHKRESPMDWSEFLNITARLEDFKSDVNEIRTKIEHRLRNNVKAVVYCNLLSDGILRREEIPEGAGPPYDLIISMLCLEIPCSDFESFVDVLKRVNTLLKKGGGLIMGSFLEADSWYVGEKKFSKLKICLKDILLALELAGFGHHEVKSFSPVHTEYHLQEHSGYYCVATEKL
ncbi:UNVERIFIED_CONTAM: Nnmt [Trichonephila clavipes]